jgi:hypothetical protein
LKDDDDDDDDDNDIYIYNRMVTSKWILGMQVVRMGGGDSASELCQMAICGISDVETSSNVARVLLSYLVSGFNMHMEQMVG